MDLIDNIFTKFEKRRDLRKLKKIAKEYEFPEIVSNQFFNSFQFLKKECVHPGNKSRKLRKRKELKDTYDFSKVKFNTLFILRAYQLTNEFLYVTKHQLIHSTLALTRAMYELLVTLIYAKNNPSVMDIITSEKDGKDKGIWEMIDELKKKKVNFYVGEITEEGERTKKDIVPDLYNDYKAFSNLMHTFKKESYHSNMFYNMDTGKDEAIVLGNWFLQYHDKKFIILRFVSYLIVASKELEMMKNSLYEKEDYKKK